METSAHTVLDLRGLPCPENATRALLALELMDEGEVLEVLLDLGEPMANVPHTLTHEQHTVLACEEGAWGRLLVRRGE